MAKRNRKKLIPQCNLEDYILPSEGFVRQRVVLNILGISDATLWRRIKEGAYPRPVKLGPNTSAWRVKDIRALIHSFDEPDVLEDKTA